MHMPETLSHTFHLSSRQAAFYAPSDTEQRLLGLILKEPDITQARLTKLMEVAQPTVSRLVSGLLDQGLIASGQKESHGRGQPSQRLNICADYAYVMGIALFADALSVTLMDFAGTVLWQATEQMATMHQPVILDLLDALKCRMVADTAIDPSRIFAAGVGISAFFVGDGEKMNPPAMLDDWALIEIGPVIADAIGLPVLVDNDGNAACIGEAHCGVGRRYRSFAYFQITNGFGGGVMINGLPHRGSHGNAGEFAAIWEAIGIAHPNLEHLRAFLEEHEVRFESVAEMLSVISIDTPGVMPWISAVTPAYNIVATAAAATLDCEAIVLGGRIPKDIARELADRIIVAHTTRRSRPLPLPDIVVSEAPGDPVSVGAAASAFKAAFFK